MAKNLDYDRIVKDTCALLKQRPLSEENKEAIREIKKSIEANPECKDIIEANTLRVFFANVLSKANIMTLQLEEAWDYYQDIQKSEDKE